MRYSKNLARFALIAGFAGCGGSEDEDVSSPDTAGAETGASELGVAAARPHWFFTCGDPVCSGWTATEGVPLCTTQEAGGRCRKIGKECDPQSDCNELLRCAMEDPTGGPFGCPISRREVKSDIAYLSDAETKLLHDELMEFRLATYRYTADPARTQHLGFIIDDVETSPAVDASGNRVDMYAYATMAVAAVQSQQAEIDQLKAQVAQLQRDLQKTAKH